MDDSPLKTKQTGKGSGKSIPYGGVGVRFSPATSQGIKPVGTPEPARRMYDAASAAAEARDNAKPVSPSMAGNAVSRAKVDAARNSSNAVRARTPAGGEMIPPPPPPSIPGVVSTAPPPLAGPDVSLTPDRQPAAVSVTVPPLQVTEVDRGPFRPLPPAKVVPVTSSKAYERPGAVATPTPEMVTPQTSGNAFFSTSNDGPFDRLHRSVDKALFGGTGGKKATYKYDGGDNRSDKD
jgi:hypothetical protein